VHVRNFDWLSFTPPLWSPSLVLQLHLRLIILSVGSDVPIDSDALLITDFVNLKIKSAQSFGGAHSARMCIRVFIGVSSHTCMCICVYAVFLKKLLII
jgi:hypothetical protein